MSENKQYHCSICNTYFDRKSKLQRHFESDKHIRNVTPDTVTPDTYAMLVTDFENFKNRFNELYQENQISKEKSKN